ncbi:DUF3828 domain-containing protein [Commensalibacter oyaizuii]|uniref:DUF3828 domain-containing protein n=1 Tax=Commensalibacter oyaizuii TaxID=3043873 RepID=A0ABT6Q3S5_9PROT|nr:DUF3828 domain-containing protein [Commensalibacter sp. TBRC 16381]MDI2091226.1 DUF3828 domain-containing protein [Commensalibacter sp. TBRC 16381]
MVKILTFLCATVNRYYCLCILSSLFFLYAGEAYAQDTPVSLIQKVYSFYTPKPDGNNDELGFDRNGKEEKLLFSPDFLKIIEADEKITSAHQDGSLIDYDFICNCQDFFDGIVVTNIDVLSQSNNKAVVKVYYNFIIDNNQSSPFADNSMPEQTNSFNLIRINHRWYIDDVLGDKNEGLKKQWQQELRQYYPNSIQ